MHYIAHIEVISEAIRARRRSLKLRQADLAELAGVSLRALIAIETGTSNPELATLSRILDVLGLTLTVTNK